MGKQNPDRKNPFPRVPYATRGEIGVCVVLGCLAILMFSLFMEFAPSLGTLVSALSCTFFYLLAVAYVGFVRKGGSKAISEEQSFSFINEQSFSVFAESRYPVLLFDALGTILWYNDAAAQILPPDTNYLSHSIAEIIGNTDGEMTENNRALKIGNAEYNAETFRLPKFDATLLMLSDESELRQLERIHSDERLAIAYITIDNVEDVLQYVQEQFRQAVSAVDARLKKWADDMNGVIKAYDNDKYILLFESSYLEKCINDRFSILDEIRETRLGDGVSITVSIGVSKMGKTLAERETAAREAIDLALQRGGDQAACKSEDGVEYFGGRTKTVYKRSNVRSRTFTTQLLALMARAENVLIMGHCFGDFDSIGASVGVSRLATLCGVKKNIAVDLHDKNIAPIIAMMRKEPMYASTFVDYLDACRLATKETLLVLTDVNTFPRVCFSDLVDKVGDIVMIDHHRKTEKADERISLSYIEPSASSTCELVTEMLQCALSSQSLTREEADTLLAGILLDTKQFTRNTGTRTFSAAQYLRGAGSDPHDVAELFKIEADDLSKEAKFHTAILLYHGNIAISAVNGEMDESYRVIASKAADKMLTLRGVDAAFTLVRIGGVIYISGRSSGKINVALILEQLHGGGHFDMAGAQVPSENETATVEQLKSAIDDYLENE